MYFYETLFKWSELGQDFVQHKRIVDKHLDNVIRQAIKSRQLASDHRVMSFLDILIDSHLQNPTLMSISDISDHLSTFVFAGHDTSALSVCFALYLVGHYPHVQQRIQQEVDQLDLANDTCNWIKNLTYLEQVIHETMRLYPPAPFIGRFTTKAIDYDHIRIPDNTDVIVSIYDIHRNVQHWPHPEIFDPDRFAPEVAKNRHPYAFIPFSGGPRNCIGKSQAMLETKSILAHIFKQYEVLSIQPRDTLRIAANVTIHMKESMSIKFIERRDVFLF